MEDQISTLPDQIVGAILSLLTIKEAGRTSVLSQRWTNLWKLFMGSMDFDGSKTMARMLRERKSKSLDTERTKYIRWVNQVMNMHQGHSVEELRICFDLNIDFGRIIDRWVKFAIEKRVRRLELDLVGYYGDFQLHKCYAFPLSPLGVLSFNSLTALRLKSVHLTDEVLAHFLSNCPLIEELSLVDSNSLVNVKIAGPLSLKHLELSFCLKLKTVEISAINLISFKYFGPCRENPFKNVPLLSKVSIGGACCELLSYTSFSDIEGVLSQLEMLMLDLRNMVCQRSNFIPNFFLGFLNLKHLELHFNVYPDQSILFLNPLIDASPCLYKLVVKFCFILRSQWRTPEPLTRDFTADFTRWEEKERRECRNGRLECLKVVEMFGWVGHTADTELSVYLLENAVSLKKMIINTSDPHDVFFFQTSVSKELKEKRNDAAARERAKQLETKLPPGAELVVL